MFKLKIDLISHLKISKHFCAKKKKKQQKKHRLYPKKKKKMTKHKFIYRPNIKKFII